MAITWTKKWTSADDGALLTGAQLGTLQDDIAAAVTLQAGTGPNQLVQLDASARLPAVDGSQLTGITATQVGAISGVGTVSPANLLFNGSFEAWSAGTSAAPDGWILTGAGASIAQESTIKKLGAYSAKLTRAGADCRITYTVSTDAYYNGRAVTFSAWVYTTAASRARLAISYGSGTAYSSYHTGNSAWQLLTVTATIGSSFDVYLAVETGDVSAYIDGAVVVEGSSVFSFSPKPAEEGPWSDYSTASTIVGWASFTTKKILTKKVGNIVFVGYRLYGTSNATTITFTVPYTAVTTGMDYANLITYAQDNGSAINTSAVALISGGQAIVTLYTSINEQTPWTASGTKNVSGCLWFCVA